MKYVVEQCVSMNLNVVVEANDEKEAFEKSKNLIQENDTSGEELFFECRFNAFIEETDDELTR